MDGVVVVMAVLLGFPVIAAAVDVEVAIVDIESTFSYAHMKNDIINWLAGK